jgi:hypothetical protein
LIYRIINIYIPCKVATIIHNGYELYIGLFNFQVEIGRLFDLQYPCTSGTGKCRTRKNNDHWTKDELRELVDGVSKEGIGKWSKLKGIYFSKSIRTPVHLKVCIYIIGMVFDACSAGAMKIVRQTCVYIYA